MSPEEFMKAVPPDLATRTASKLDPHREAIETLRAAGYSLRQVCEYLEQCGVTVALPTLSKFLRPRTAKRSAVAPAEPVRPAQATPLRQPAHTQTTDSSGRKSREHIADENPGLTKKQVEAMYVDQFAQRAENPLLRRAKKA